MSTNGVGHAKLKNHDVNSFLGKRVCSFCGSEPNALYGKFFTAMEANLSVHQYCMVSLFYVYLYDLYFYVFTFKVV